MRKVIYILLLFFVSCSNEIKQKEVVIRETADPVWKADLDTILEKTNPLNLDLSKHQLYIDTTRNSENYEELINWSPGRMDREAISYYQKEISKKYKPIKIDLKKFPRYWVSLEKLNNEFVIYKPCDGNTTSFEIDESTVSLYYGIESDADLIFRSKKIVDNEISLELRTVSQKIKSEKTELTIKPTELANVFLLTYSFGEWYVTPIDSISEFDMVVNHCPKMKRIEFNRFDK